MKALLRRLVGAGIPAIFPLLAPGAIVFQDGFESGSLGPAWLVSTTDQGRVAVTSNFDPAAGSYHLVLDDSVNDAQYSASACTLRLDLSNKKNVLLTFKAKSLGDEFDWPAGGSQSDPPKFDGVSVSEDGGVFWRIVQPFTDLTSEWKNYSIPLDYYLEGHYSSLGPDVRIRFSQYDNASAPLDGIAFDDVVVTAEDDQRAALEIPRQLVEGTGPHTGYVLLAFAPTNDLTLTFAASVPGQFLLPATVVVPAGQRQASFGFSVADDSLVNLTRWVTLNVAAPEVRSIGAYISIRDDEMPVVTLSLPSLLTEGVTVNDNASITLDRAPDVPFTLDFYSDAYAEVSPLYNVTIPAGQTQATFPVNAVDDTRIDGNVLVTVVVRSDGLPVATNQVTTVDNEVRSITLVVPATVQEGSTTTGRVTISGTLPTHLKVKLASSNPAGLAVPGEITIPAGGIEVQFPLTAPDNGLRDGSRHVTINASADTFGGASAEATIRDDEVAGYRFGAVADLVNVSSTLAIRVAAADTEGNVILGASSSVQLSVVLPDGTALPLAPASVALSGEIGWAGDVSFPKLVSSPLRLRATDGDGISGESAEFDLMRTLDLSAGDLVWDSTRRRFYASEPSGIGGVNAGRVVAIDPASATIVGSVVLPQRPGQLALTSGGESLYVVTDFNGRVSRLDPESLTVVWAFPVGSDPNYGALYAGDICPVTGQPDLLVISRRRSDGYGHFGVAAYENGIARPTITQPINGTLVIEPSAEPDILFAYDQTGATGFRRLRLDASGITELEVNQTVMQEYGADIVSEGNLVFSSGGTVVDGAQMRRLGAFPIRGPVRPDLAVNRVYAVELMGPDSWDYYGRISAYDPITFSPIRTLTMSSLVKEPKRLIRWSTNGLAFLTTSNLVLVNSSRLVPSDPPADLAVSIEASPNPASVSASLTYTVTVASHGPNTAEHTLLAVELSDHQTILSASMPNGAPLVVDKSISLPAGDLVTGATVKLAITVLPQSAGILACKAKVISDAPDLSFADNSATQLVRAGYQLTLDAVSTLRLAANNLVYDSTRNLLWASLPSAVPYLGASVVSIDPRTGVISDPIPIGGEPADACMAMTADGRYLYVGLTDSAVLFRLDLRSAGVGVRIPLGQNEWGGPMYARDVEPLNGDGTSFLVASGSQVVVFDADVPRTNRASVFTSHIESTGDATTFIGADGDTLSRLAVTAKGVEAAHSANHLIGYGGDIRGAGNLILASSGQLINTTDFTLRAYFETSGSPCLDLANHRAYLAQTTGLHAFDTETLLPAGEFALSGDYWPKACVRWGLDGFAILGHDGLLRVFRWSATIPSSTDANADGMADAWEAAHFGTLQVNPAGDDDGDGLRNFQEYLFGTSPLEASVNPVQYSVVSVAGQTALRLVFPRRAGISPQPYTFVVSSNLLQWSAAEGVSETVLPSGTVEGVPTEMVEAIIPFADLAYGFVRFQWMPQ